MSLTPYDKDLAIRSDRGSLAEGEDLCITWELLQGREELSTVTVMSGA
jgi:hypothetical protein